MAERFRRTSRTAPRVIASDLDGTLFGSDHRVSARTVAALRSARDAGIRVVAATGRAPLSAMDRLAHHDVVDALVCSNGSIIHDVASDRTIHRFPIESDHMVALFTSLDAAVPELSYCWEMESTSGWDQAFDDIALDHDDLRTFAIAPRPEAGTPITKVMVRHPTLMRQELADAIEPHLPAPLSLGCSGVEFVEITGAGIDKARALRFLTDGWGVDATDVIAFGDNHNDVAMLAWAGHGVAVANAADAAKEVADEIIGDHRRDAVATYIEDHLLS